LCKNLHVTSVERGPNFGNGMLTITLKLMELDNRFAISHIKLYNKEKKYIVVLTLKCQ